jgi:hypothetical protein
MRDGMGARIANGVYLARLRSGPHVRTCKVIVMN